MNTEQTKNTIKNWFAKTGKPYERIETEFQNSSTEAKVIFTTVWNHRLSTLHIILHASVIDLLSVDQIDNILDKFLDNARKEAGHIKGEKGK